MTLQTLLYNISEYGISRKIINYSAAGTSIYELNNQNVKNYPILFASPTGTHTVGKDTTTFSLTLYYIDRLLTDSSNDVEVFSTAVEVLKSIIVGIDNMDGVVGVSDSYSVTNFTDTEVMSDRCAGAYATVDITVLNDSICEEI